MLFMFGARNPLRLALERVREAVIAALERAFAGDEIGIEEYERRVAAALQASSLSELYPLTADVSTFAPPADEVRKREPRGTRLAWNLSAWDAAWLAVLAWCAFCCVDFARYMLTH
ncbi:MAG TPA: DUF1707 domain-containing protein [Lacunisphaera sp.]|nr:DUF1707 domain-containing protein [Lacunisphaera sp.]